MTQIKIEVPANDHIALSAMADALQRIATEHASSVSVVEPENIPEGVVQRTPVNPAEAYGKAGSEHYGSNTGQLNDELEHASQPDHDEAFEEGEKLFDAEIARMDEERERDDTLDADGIPHDKRIHSKGATRLADNTWRLRKRPADKTEEEWTAYIDSVKAEFKAVQDIPTLDEQAVADLTPPEAEFTEQQAVDHIGNVNDNPMDVVEPTLDEQAVADLTPPVIDTDTPNGMSEANETPVAPVTPPTSLTPPVVEAASDKPSVTTFQELMLYMTSDAKKRGADNDTIKATLLEVDPALTAIPLIATRADLIPKFVTALEAKLK